MAFMLLACTGVQFAQTALTRKSDIDNEVARQQGICDQISDITTKQIPRLQGLRSQLSSGATLSDETSQELFTLSGTIQAIIKNTEDLKQQGFTKLLIQIVVDIIIVAIVAFYIINKKFR
jgi:hypothetical protein